MTLSEQTQSELTDLLEAVCLGTASEAQLARLQVLVAPNDETREFYLRYLRVHAGLQWHFRDDLSPEPELPVEAASGPIAKSKEAASPIFGFLGATYQQLAGRFGVAAPLVVLLLLVCVAFYGQNKLSVLPAKTAEPNPTPVAQATPAKPDLAVPGRLAAPSPTGASAVPLVAHGFDGPQMATPVSSDSLETDRAGRQPRFFATLTSAEHCLWAGGKLPTTTGSRLTGGTLTLAQGNAEITFDRGARLVMTGPSVLEIQSSGRAFLRTGSVTAEVPQQAIGFTIDTASSRTIDLGTAFGVRAGESGDSEIHTFTGVVEVQLGRQSGQGAGEPAEKLLITAGHSLHVDRNGVKMAQGEAQADLFVRPLPETASAYLDKSMGRYASIVQADRPVGYWRFEDVELAADQSAADASTRHNPGWYRGGVSSVEGAAKIGGHALALDGTTGYLNIPHHPDYSSPDISVEFWVRGDEPWEYCYWPGSAALVSKVVPGAHSCDWTIVGGSLVEGQDQGRVIVGLGVSHVNDGSNATDDPQLISSRPANDRRWHHVVWTRSAAGTNVLYLDGDRAAELQEGGEAINNAMDIQVGGDLRSAIQNESQRLDKFHRPLADRSFLQGAIDELAIYDHPLDCNRVREHYRIAFDAK